MRIQTRSMSQGAQETPQHNCCPGCGFDFKANGADFGKPCPQCGTVLHFTDSQADHQGENSVITQDTHDRHDRS